MVTALKNKKRELKSSEMNMDNDAVRTSESSNFELKVKNYFPKIKFKIKVIES